MNRALFEKANEMHPKKRRIVAESRAILLWKDVKTAGIADMCQLWAFSVKNLGIYRNALMPEPMEILCAEVW